MAGERISARRLAPAYRRWAEKGQELRSDIRYEARRYPELLDPVETAIATAAEVGHLARLARDAQRAEYAYRKADWGRVGALLFRRDGRYYSPVAKVLLAWDAVRLDGLKELRESYRQLANERPVLDDSAIRMLTHAEAFADDQPAAYLKNRATQMQALLSPETRSAREEQAR
ncbi:hypothetical protein [Streptomyces sp. AC04842]|uniref:hypothetical protein n=1 Tax=Streptomyces sp. AC04842 TaxID=2775327 RepID=UPI0020C65AFD|nr:hypothetical protein [Streptomyces sp. AC04842]